MESKSLNISKSSLWMLIFVTSMGYFVDAADLVIASLVRANSIKALGIATDDTLVKQIGLSLESWQSWGILFGGILFGIFGDKIGRLKVLYFSIACYSIATLLNGFLSPEWGNTLLLYKVFRFFSGLGLAGELGIGVTIVSEVMKKEKRGIGTMIIASFGILGCVAAASLVAFIKVPWNTAFIIGGASGLLLLFLRMGVHESSVYLEQTKSNVSKGSFLSFFNNSDRFKRLLICILIGLPTYYVVGLPIKFASNFGKALNIEGVSVPIAMITFYIAMSTGDLICNSISQKIKSRKKMFFFYNTMSLISILLFTYMPPTNAWQYHFIYCPLLGFSVGYWALIVTVAAESFGTNLRASAATSVPNFIRSSFIPIAMFFTLLEAKIGTIHSGGLIGVICCIIALVATYNMKETFGQDLNFIEE
jgi:putative MFS transporter